MQTQMCNIVDKDGAVVNNKPFRLEEALSLLAGADAQRGLSISFSAESVEQSPEVAALQNMHIRCGWVFGPTAAEIFQNRLSGSHIDVRSG